MSDDEADTDTEVEIEYDGDPVERPELANTSNDVPLTPADVADAIEARLPGALAAVGGVIHRIDPDRGAVPLARPAELFGWLAGEFKVRWSRKGMSREEFHAALRDVVPRYAWTWDRPHYPPVPGCLYTGPAVAPRETGAIARIVAQFAPAGRTDARLIEAMIMTLAWGGSPGSRPAFLVTTAPGAAADRGGTGVGKTTLAEMVARAFGGYIPLRPGRADRVTTCLLSPEAAQKRCVVWDNARGAHLADEVMESLMTGDTVGGHRLYHGYTSRPNYFTIILTANSADLSRDLAERAAVVRLADPPRTPGWRAETESLIDELAEDLWADLAWRFGRPPREVAHPGRWAAWAREVVGRLPAPASPNNIMQALETRRRAIDGDARASADWYTHFVGWIAEALPGCVPDAARVRIPSSTFHGWVQGVLPAATSHTAAAIVRDHLPMLAPVRWDHGRVRGYLFTGPGADPENPVTVLPFPKRRGRER